jgi:capsular polysaccharide transport system permease protein
VRLVIAGAFTQLRVIHAVALRETKTRFGQHRAGYLWALVEPIVWIGTFFGLYTIMGRQGPDGMALVPFLTTGILAYQIFAQTVDKVSQSINGNKALLFYPQVQPLDLVFARTLLEAVTYVIVFAVIVGGHALVVQSLAIHSILETLLGFSLASLLGMSVGLVFCALNVVSATADRVRGPLLRPMFWISGLFFTANALPSQVREVFLWNPVLHCVELVRAGWFPEYHARYASPTYVLAWIIAFAFVGLTLERAVRRKVQLT